MGWPEAVVLLGLCATVAVIVWAVSRRPRVVLPSDFKMPEFPKFPEWPIARTYGPLGAWTTTTWTTSAQPPSPPPEPPTAGPVPKP